ncbi:MAG TPA: HepT-like ribonuclease domain-containing protein [Thermoanaerobaculia bacterium]
MIVGRRGWIDHDLAGTLAKRVGMRNRLVHDYDDLDLDKVRHALDEDLDDLLGFADSIRRRLTESTAG